MSGIELTPPMDDEMDILLEQYETERYIPCASLEQALEDLRFYEEELTKAKKDLYITTVLLRNNPDRRRVAKIIAEKQAEVDELLLFVLDAKDELTRH
ncbi:MAG: hypothetical protein K2Q45_03230 [Nitrosomonas sp.]|nr:hypothetical protein [Nitrosomonas sp.]